MNAIPSFGDIRSAQPSPYSDSPPASVPRARSLDGSAGRVPPADLDAERIVLDHALRTGSLGGLEALEPEHFYSPAHATIWRSVQALAAEGLPVGYPMLGSRLRELGRLDEVGGVRYLADVADAPAAVRIEPHADVVLRKAELRRLVAVCQRFAVEGYGATDAASLRAELLAQAADAIDGSAARRGFELVEAGAIFEPQPSTDWLCRDLAIVAGAPCGWFAFAWGGKSLVLQDFALSIATGDRVFGQFSAKRGRVVHIDHEQGLRETLDRYQRLARARGLTLESVEGNLAVCCLPAIYLTSPGAYDAYCRAADGAVALYVDSLAAAQPGVEENATEFADGLYMLGRVSAATGATPIVAGHTGKLDLADVKPSDGRVLPRGTSAIVAACGSAFTLAGGKGEPKLVRQIKGRSLGAPMPDDFYLSLGPVEIPGYSDPGNPGDPGGFAVRYLTAEQVKPPKSAERQMRELVEHVSGVLRAHPGVSKRELRRLAGGRATDTDAALDALERTGRLRVDPGKRRGGGAALFLVEADGGAE